MTLEYFLIPNKCFLIYTIFSLQRKMTDFLKSWVTLGFFFPLWSQNGFGKKEICPCLHWTSVIKYCCTNLHNSRQLGRVQVTASNWFSFLLPGTTQITALAPNKWPLALPNNRFYLFLRISVSLTSEVGCINIEGIIEIVYCSITTFYKADLSFTLLTPRSYLPLHVLTFIEFLLYDKDCLLYL